MQMINLTQGSPEWHAHRAAHFNASDCAAMLELLREKATGLVPEVDEATQRRFDEGHRFEALARPIAEAHIGDELYPCVGVLEGTKLSASFDGLTMDGTVVWEHKTLNNELRAAISHNDEFEELPQHYRAQLEQQLLVSGAEKSLFMASHFNNDGELIECRQCIYEYSPIMRQRILDGWAQFEKDLAGYQPQPLPAPKPVGKAPESLPALHIQATGKVLASNLDAFKQHAFAVLDSINRDLQTDDDFANADATIKWCKQIEQKLDATKQHVLSQTVDIEAVFRTIDDVSGHTRNIRLELEKLAKVKKEHRKLELVNTGVEAVIAHLAACNQSLGEFVLPLRGNPMTEFSAAIKGLRSLASMQDAINTKVAEWKIALDADTRRIQANSELFAEHASNMHLFPDVSELVQEKSPEDLRNLITARIAEAGRAERERQERQEQARRLDAHHGLAQTQAGLQRTVESRLDAHPQVQQLAELYTPPAGRAYETADSCTRDAADDGALIKLGDINTATAPLSITAEGLKQFGFEPVATDKSAKLYRARYLETMLRHMAHHLVQVANQKWRNAELSKQAA